MRRALAIAGTVVLAVTATARSTSAQGVDVTLFVGRAFPTYDERLTLRPSIPALPGVEVTTPLAPELRADGGGVLGAALAVELGIFGIEGRIDATDVGLEFTGARYELRATQPPLAPFTATLTAAAGRFDADRIKLLSLNARLRTPGPVALVASGGLSYLPDIRVTGSMPISLEIPGVPPSAALNGALVLHATPGTAEHRFGVNAGAGIRVGGRVALLAEARAFYFREYELQFGAAEEVLDDVLTELHPVRFTPVFVNVQAGIVFRF